MGVGDVVCARHAGPGRRTFFFALTASGYAASSAFTTATDTLNLAAMSRGVHPSCTCHTARGD